LSTNRTQFEHMSSRPIENPIMHPEALWDLAAIMAWARYGETQARKMVADPAFPRPVRLLGDSSDPRWIAGEVWRFKEAKR
jgi:predicted DNA-binding transcriptional regulator AlpA